MCSREGLQIAIVLEITKYDKNKKRQKKKRITKCDGITKRDGLQSIQYICSASLLLTYLTTASSPQLFCSPALSVEFPSAIKSIRFALLICVFRTISSDSGLVSLLSIDSV